MADNFHQQELEFDVASTIVADSDFRLWVNCQWFDYREECLAWEGKMPKGSTQDYFNKYKWFLKAKYKQENV